MVLYVYCLLSQSRIIENIVICSPINKCISLSEVKRHGQNILPIQE